MLEIVTDILNGVNHHNKKSKMKKYFEKDKPIKKQVIIFKTKEGFYPEIGVFETFENGVEEVYVPANDDVEQLENIEWWSEVPE